jgi:hypothetical protein
MPSKIPEWRRPHKIQGVSHTNGHVNFVSNYVLQWRMADGGGRPPRETAGRRPPHRILAKELKGKLNASKMDYAAQGPRAANGWPMVNVFHREESRDGDHRTRSKGRTVGRWRRSAAARNSGTATAAQVLGEGTRSAQRFRRGRPGQGPGEGPPRWHEEGRRSSRGGSAAITVGPECFPGIRGAGGRG